MRGVKYRNLDTEMLTLNRDIQKKPGPSAKSQRSAGVKKLEETMRDTKSVEEQAEQFEKELCWCIEQLELGLSTRAPDSRQAHEAVKVLRVLRNPKTLLVKKRQVMRTTFGDYRKKIDAEERKLAAKASKISLTTPKSTSQSKVYGLCRNKQVDSKVNTNQRVEDANTEDGGAQEMKGTEQPRVGGEFVQDKKGLQSSGKTEGGVDAYQHVDEVSTGDDTPVGPTNTCHRSALHDVQADVDTPPPVDRSSAVLSRLIDKDHQVYSAQVGVFTSEDGTSATHQPPPPGMLFPNNASSDKTFEFVKSDNSFRFSFTNS